MSKYDAVVVGAGNAGLTAALRLAKSGKKTLLIEQHNLPGGVATSFRRGRFEFETALHELCDFGPESDRGDARKLLEDQFGLNQLNIEWHMVPDTYRCISRDRDGSRLDVTMPAGREAYIGKMEEYVPGSRESTEKFFDLADETVDALTYIGASNGEADPKVMLEKYPNFLRTAAHPVNEVLSALGMPQKAQDILNVYWSYIGADNDRVPFMHYAALVQNYVYRCAYIPDKTSHQITAGLVERYREYGGEIWFNCRAEKFLFDGDHVCGIQTTCGVIDTDYVIFNGNPTMAYANMIPKELVPEREVKLANARTFSGRMFVAYLGLNKSAEELGIKDYSIFMPSCMDSPKEYDRLRRIETNEYSIFLCYNIVNPNASPEGTCIVSFTTFYSDDCWGGFEPENYVKIKNEIAEGIIDKFEAETGIGIRDSIEEFSVATPWTYSRYAASPEGAVYGYEMSGWDSTINRMLMIEEDYPIKGLKFCGAAGPQGAGYSTTYIGGDQMGQLTMKQMAEEAATKEGK